MKTCFQLEFVTKKVQEKEEGFKVKNKQDRNKEEMKRFRGDYGGSAPPLRSVKSLVVIFFGSKRVLSPPPPPVKIFF